MTYKTTRSRKMNAARRTIIVLGLCTLGGCAQSASVDETELIQSSLRGGDVITGAAGVVDFDQNGWGCTGSIITPTAVLTAAHCFKNLGSKTGVHSGTTSFNINYYDPINGRRSIYSGTANWYAYPSFDGGSGAAQSDDDIALIQLPTPFETINYHDYLRLYSDLGTSLSTWLTEYGAGIYNYSGNDDLLLRKASFEVEDVTDWHIAVDTRQYVGTCHGDSGGPLVQEVTLAGKPLQVIAGVLSNSDKDKGDEGPYCSNNDFPNDNAYYCRTRYPRIQWIESTLGVSCDLYEGGSLDYRRCFKLPFIEDIDGESLALGTEVAIVMAAMF